MLKKMILGFLLVSSFSAVANEDTILKAMQTNYPKAKITSVVKTPFQGLYEVFIDGEIVYTNENFSWFIVNGRLVDVKARKELTAGRLAELNRVDFDQLPLEQAIKVVRGNGNRKLVVFSDPDCPFCKKLERKELSIFTDITIYTFLIPLENLHPDAARKSEAIWCAADRVKAWNDWILNDKLAKDSSSCDTPLKKNSELANQLGISSTPTLIFANGLRVLGAQPSAEIERMLAK